MALVSISEASRLTNKSRTTVHRYISKGKLSIPVDRDARHLANARALPRAAH